MKQKNMILSNLTALSLNILLVFGLYTLCRLLFVWCNAGLYENLSFGNLMHLLAAGLIFDSSAIFYTNALVIILFLFPLHWKEKRWFYTTNRWIYTIVNTIALLANICDMVYFAYTGKRTTCSVFAEFSNEGGNMMKIMGEQIVANWPLALVFLLFVAALWLGFRNPQKQATKPARLAVYYPVMLAILLATVYFVWGQMRGGYTFATRPITISNANKYASTPAEAGAILNTPFSLIRTLGKKPLVTPQYMSDEEAEQIFSPLHSPQDGKEFRPMNVVVLIMESFSKQHMGFYNDLMKENGGTCNWHTYTPFLDSLIAQSGYTFRYSFANGRKSIEGMPSVLSSIPNFVEPFFLTPASMNSISGIARELAENKGYHTAFFHGAENGSMGFEAFAKSTGFVQYFGRTEYNQAPHYDGDKDFDGTWAIFDEPFLQFYADRMNEMKEPFVTAVFTASSHSPFPIPEQYKGVFPKGMERIQECVAYSDHALRKFFAKASTMDWYKNTLFVITADHVSAPTDKFYLTTLGHYSVPIIFYAPGLKDLKGYEADMVVEQTDIMPTILGLLGYDKPYIAFGNDLFSIPREKSYALHWVPEFDGYEFVKGKYLMRFDGKEIMSVFDYRDDILQTEDIKDVMPRGTRDSLEREMKAVIQQYMRCMNGDKLTVKRYNAASK
ncbi:MAG: LTA synthase family protein [Bacteroidales bacterium]|nr:LTA synthase family protein [Bacteroidales bacterium]